MRDLDNEKKFIKFALTCGWLTVMQMLETLRLVVMMMVGRPHRRTHSVVAMLMMRRASPMWMILGGMMLMRMIGGRQKARCGRVHAARTVAGRPAECCYGTINRGIQWKSMPSQNVMIQHWDSAIFISHVKFEFHPISFHTIYNNIKRNLIWRKYFYFKKILKNYTNFLCYSIFFINDNCSIIENRHRKVLNSVLNRDFFSMTAVFLLWNFCINCWMQMKNLA